LLGYVRLNKSNQTFKRKLTNLCTNGDTIITAGKATINEDDHALNQMFTISLTSPMLIMLMTRDIIHDISNDSKNENINL